MDVNNSAHEIAKRIKNNSNLLEEDEFDHRGKNGKIETMDFVIRLLKERIKEIEDLKSEYLKNTKQPLPFIPRHYENGSYTSHRNFGGYF